MVDQKREKKKQRGSGYPECFSVPLKDVEFFNEATNKYVN